MEDTKENTFCQLTLNEILTILCAASIPIALGIYTGITTAQDQQASNQRREFDLKQAAELRQQKLYDKFISDMYMLDKDGHLDDTDSPWAFANAFHRSAHRQWDAIRKVDVIQFLKEKQLIGTFQSISSLRMANDLEDIIRLNELNFDNVHLTSQTNSLNQLNLSFVPFNQVSLVKASFTFVNVSYASFTYSRLNYARFNHSSLAYATFDSTELRGTNFGNSDLTGTRFLNVNLLTAILTSQQIQQAYFYNTTLPNGTYIGLITTTQSSTMIATTVEEAISTSNQLNGNITTNFQSTISTSTIDLDLSTGTTTENISAISDTTDTHTTDLDLSTDTSADYGSGVSDATATDTTDFSLSIDTPANKISAISAAYDIEFMPDGTDKETIISYGVP